MHGLLYFTHIKNVLFGHAKAERRPLGRTCSFEKQQAKPQVTFHGNQHSP